ncbi:L,D-transpeptidase [Butyrivibrio sp. YAB3001]|uniref:L,D-transpeptidase n=1 Tax=Butyrivibrio sp. YAB3001 TaxID=1520812 RepID=UPI0008F65BFF|nr:L,D-transpeptidase [Butyrivibrio sp. YAB3001]SFC80914.1 L,D-transpeptidase catalytic domain [Butyrivibrio sp. YAB3001]
MKKSVVTMIITVSLFLGGMIFLSTSAKASDFDAEFYAKMYPDVVAVCGTDPEALYNHYVTFGVHENRYKNAEEMAYGIGYDETPAASDTPATPGALQSFETYVDVDIANQQMTYYVLGEPVLSSAIVTGNASNGNDTPTGTFYINTKIPGKYLVGPTWNVWVDRWMKFTGNVGLHDASWRSEFGGDIYKRNGSHGCVNLPSDVAKTLYDMVDIGTMVKVH